ncbi:MAG TPA: hypothetical protein VG323_15370, partial [Thermoanaerobaculia bacterium]|nr:hypothetical protein [Thermoanaerobaculia bacterium]
GRSIRFGDGYAIEITTLANTPSSFVVRLVATAPHGPSSTAIVARSLRTGETTHSGAEGLSLAMRRSRHAQIAAQVLFELQKASAEGRKLQVGSLSRPPFTVRPMDCLTDGIGVITAAVGMLRFCSNPATALECFGAVDGFLVATYSLLRDCPDTYLDNSIGF